MALGLSMPGCDLFCAVVDNYGDVGVGWRLARQLVRERNWSVRFWVDDWRAFARLCPSLDPGLPVQWVQGVEVRRWSDGLGDVTPARIVIELFGCALPEAYLAAMAQAAVKPVWINLEYLSAEAWVDGCHGLASPHPFLPLTRYFFFPGFSDASGGLLREHDLLALRAEWDRDAPVRTEFLQRLGAVPREGMSLSLFAYPHSGLPEWWEVLSASTEPVTCLLPAGSQGESLRAAFGRVPAPGECLQRGALSLVVFPWLDSADYDRLLWCCDVNAVRGEDSFVRAQWAQRPLLWQIYPQTDGAHRIKLEAFLQRYVAGLPAAVGEAQVHLWRAWNGFGSVGLADAWLGWQPHLAVLRTHAAGWANALAVQPGLADALANFCENRL